jgi:beta-lactamase regulating signal transducer with metallopeptidase domain
MNYILKLSIFISIVYLLYILLFRRWTFHQLNRWYLLLFSVASFFIPLIDISPALQESSLNQNQIIQFVPSISNYSVEQSIPKENGFLYINYLYAVIVAGVIACFFRLLVQFLSYRKLMRSASLIVDSHIKVFQVNKDIVPFSFGNSIFISHHEHSEAEITEIIRHEFIHVKQKHSLDIVLSEILCIINWYNPFAWLIRHAIRQNLEFIADEQVLRKGFDKKQYMYLLLKVIGIRQFSIATSFNATSLKKRIAMMNKNKTARIHLVRTILILPLLVVVLLAFRNNATIPSLPSLVLNDTIPKPTVPKGPGLPENVFSIHIKNSSATVKLKDGTVEHYDLSKEVERAAYEKKYGKITEAPEPPTPPDAQLPQAPAAPATPAMPQEYSDFLKRNKNVSSVYVKDGNTMVVKLKNGSLEEYDLDDDAQSKAAKNKYGKLPATAPPAPPAAPNPPNPPAPEISAVSVVDIEPLVATTVNIQQAPNAVVVQAQPVLANPKNIKSTQNVNVTPLKAKVSVNTNINAVIAPAKAETKE